MKISVIVPIYNMELYLEKCVKSILEQTYQNLEILLINDGSTDKSGELCEKFTSSDNRVRVFHQENKGLLQTRYYGLLQAKGDVITFVDSDDWIEKDMYQSMMEVYIREQPELLSSGYTLTSEYDEVICIERELLKDGNYLKTEIEKNILPYVMWSDIHNRCMITPSVWNKFFRVERLKEIFKNIDMTITWGEDASIVYPYIFMANKISIVNGGWYHYVDRKDSMTKKTSIDVFKQIYKIERYFMNRFKNYFIDYNMEYQIKQYIKSFLRVAIGLVYNISIEKMNYLFPYEDIPKGSKIILYGAGKVGYSYWNMLINGRYVEVVSVVDKFNKGYINGYYKIESPYSITNKVFDYIVIAIDNEQYAEEIRLELIENKIPNEKIFWEKPILIE